tara:strand:+ start:67 stop:723 length:657 start_codon:yes stop_codon:yes gene_type:complete
MKFLISQSIKMDDNGTKYNRLDDKYHIFFQNINISLIPVDNFISDKKKYFNSDIKGVILSGSGDIEKIPDIDTIDRKPYFFQERDHTENILIEYALNLKIPLIGICHGMQKINDYFGGSIHAYYHHKRETYSEQGISHDIQGLDDLIGKDKIYSINQYHDHCILIEDLADNLKCFAVDVRFNTVEGFYNNEDRILGIQWHPEREINDNVAQDIFYNFL